LKISPKERRERLFKKHRPVAKKLEIMDGENYSKDVAYLWAAYKAGSFKDLPDEITQEQFAERIEQLHKMFDAVWLIEDINPAYNGGIGPVAMACTKSMGLVVNVEGVGFKWAKRRNLVRSAASFLQMIRSSLKTGIVMVKGNKEQVPFLKSLKRYDLLFYLGQPAKGEYLFSVRGRGSE
jgi:hypothetical protein